MCFLWRPKQCGWDWSIFIYKIAHKKSTTVIISKIQKFSISKVVKILWIAIFQEALLPSSSYNPFLVIKNLNIYSYSPLPQAPQTENLMTRYALTFTWNALSNNNNMLSKHTNSVSCWNILQYFQYQTLPCVPFSGQETRAPPPPPKKKTHTTNS